MIDCPEFRSRPAKGQFARLGRWESAWQVDPTQPANKGDLIRYLDGASEIAFEAFFGGAFFGIRCENPPPKVEAFSLNCLSAFSQASDGQDFFGRLAGLTGCGRLGKRLACAEVGAVNAWKSEATFRVNRVALLDQDSEALCADLQRSALAQNETNPKAIEFVFFGQLPHWFGFPVSEQDPPYAIVRVKLEEALRAFTDWSNSDQPARPREFPLGPLGR